MKQQRKLILILAVVLSVAIAAGGTMAYLQDTDEDVNVMTLGSVYIVQNEQEWQDGKLVPFTNNKPLYPYVGEFGWNIDKNDPNLTEEDKAYRQMTMENVVDKYVTVTNTGKSPAYVRTVIALEMGDYSYEEFKMIGLNINAVNGTEFKFPGTWEWVADFVAEIDGHNYNIMIAEHQNPLAPDETTIPSLNQIYLSKDAGNEEVEKLDGNGNGKYDVLVLSQAVQTMGFADANTALNEAFPYGENYANVPGWFKGEIGSPGDKNIDNNPPVYVRTEEDVANVLNEENGEDEVIYNLNSNVKTVDNPLFREYTTLEPYTFEGNGKTVELVAGSAQTFDWTENYTIPLMAMVFSSAEGAQVTVNDLTIAGTMQSVMAGNYEKTNQGRHNTVFNNVNIVNTKVVSLSSNISPALSVYGKLEMNNCNVYGTTLSPLDTDPMWPVYDMAIVNESNTTVNGGKIGSIISWAKAKLQLNGVEVESITPVGNMNTSATYGIYINEGTTVGTLDLSNIVDKNKINITIADGANVGKIVANGQEYATLEAWKTAE